MPMRTVHFTVDDPAQWRPVGGGPAVPSSTAPWAARNCGSTRSTHSRRNYGANGVHQPLRFAHAARDEPPDTKDMPCPGDCGNRSA